MNIEYLGQINMSITFAFLLLMPIALASGCSNGTNGCQTCNNNDCIACLNGYYYLQGICRSCQSGCQNCNQDLCTSCYSGYAFWYSDCLKCPLNCIACSYSYQTVELICDACQSGSSLQNNSCIQSPSSNTDNIGSTSISTISIVIPIISVFLLCLFIYIVWRRCKRRQPLPEAPREIPLNSLGSRSAINIENLGRMQWKRINGQSYQLQEECIICQVSVGNAVMSCGHIYHPKCINEWLRRKNTCPMCRSSVSNMVTVVCTKCKQFSLQKHLLEIIMNISREIEYCSYCKGDKDER